MFYPIWEYPFIWRDGHKPKQEEAYAVGISENSSVQAKINSYCYFSLGFAGLLT